jgi:hypothetical protein
MCASYKRTEDLLVAEVNTIKDANGQPGVF